MSKNYVSTSDWGKIKNRKAYSKYEDYDYEEDYDDFTASDMDILLDEEENKSNPLDLPDDGEDIEVPDYSFDMDSYLFDINLYKSKDDVKNISDDEYNKVLCNLVVAPTDIQNTKEYKLILKLFS